MIWKNKFGWKKKIKFGGVRCSWPLVLCNMRWKFRLTESKFLNLCCSFLWRVYQMLLFCRDDLRVNLVQLKSNCGKGGPGFDRGHHTLINCARIKGWLAPVVRRGSRSKSCESQINRLKLPQWMHRIHSNLINLMVRKTVCPLIMWPWRSKNVGMCQGSREVTQGSKGHERSRGHEGSPKVMRGQEVMKGHQRSWEVKMGHYGPWTNGNVALSW